MKSTFLGQDPYVSCFNDWHNNASISVKRDEYSLEYSKNNFFFPPELVPSAFHEIGLERGDSFIREILIHHLYAYLDFTEVLEHSVVNRVCYQIARGEIGINLPYGAKLDAYRICVDESFHAFRSAEIKQQIQRATGVSPIKLKNLAFLEDFDELQENTDNNIRNLLKIFFVIITETAITGNLSKIPKNNQVVKAVRDLVSDHAQDEKKHSMYFESLLKLIWEQLSLDIRVRIGVVLPRLIFIFLKPDLRTVRNYLTAVNLDAHEIDSILDEAYSETEELQRIKTAAKPTLAVLKRNGIFKEPSITEAFEMSRLI